MSEERTQNLEQKYDKKPTLDTVLERLGEIEARFGKRFDALEIRLDRTASASYETRSEMPGLRADFKELKGQIKEHFPLVK